ncbi:MAG: hypothetical protein ACR2JG_15270 [Geodermatophilaceae bacterium]
MSRRGLLVAVSGGQLGLGLVGLVVAITRRHAYELPLMQGDPARTGRDALTMGTALSAPAPMLLAQAVATVTLGRRPDQRAARALSALGALMVPGYLGEALVRHRLTPAGWDRLESPLAAGGLGLALAMAVLSPKVRTLPRPGRTRPGSGSARLHLARTCRARTHAGR